MDTTEVGSNYIENRASLLAEFDTRYPWVKTTARAIVCLIYDHGTTNIRDYIWPKHKELGLPATMALAPALHLPPFNDSANSATVSEISTMVSEGLTLASHSYDHADAECFAEVYRESSWNFRS